MAERAKVFNSGNGQSVRLPERYHFDSSEILVHRDGLKVILEPLPSKKEWPEGFWELFSEEDPTFEIPSPLPTKPFDLD